MIYNFSDWKVVLAFLVYVIVGMLWYSPVVFGKAWLSALGKKKMDRQGGPILITVLATAVAVLVLTYFANVTGIPTVARGAYLGAKLWLGFVATTALIGNAFERRPLQVLTIDLGYHLVGLVAAGIVLAS